MDSFSMSSAAPNYEPHERTFIIDDSEDPLMEYYWPGASSRNDRGWDQALVHPYQAHPLDRSLKAYDPAAHGFVEPFHRPQHQLPFQHNMHNNWHYGWHAHPSHRQRSPVSGISLSSIDSGSPTHAMSPEMATAAFPNMLTDYSIYPSPTSDPGEPGHYRSAAQPMLAAGSHPSSTMVPSGFRMKEFMLHQIDDDMLDSNDIVDPQAPLPQELELEHSEDENTDSGMGQSVGNSYTDEDAAADDGDMEYLDEAAEKEGNDNDSTYEASLQPPGVAEPQHLHHGHARTLSTTCRAPGTGITDPHARVRKQTSTSTSTRTPSKSKVKTKQPPRRISPASLPRSGAAISTQPISSARQPFPCPFHHFGCEATFPSKNEWKRHALSQHLRLGFFRCDLGACALSHPSNITATRGFNDFNRKDLFTQHCRRMHKLASWGRREYGEVGVRERKKFDEHMDVVRERCWVTRREAPRQVACGFCGEGFEDAVGRDVWEVRMEHVAKHYEREGRSMEEEKLDEGLLDWAVETGVVVGGAGELDGEWCLSVSAGGRGVGSGEQGETVRRKGKAVRPSTTPMPQREGSRRSGRARGEGRTVSYVDGVGLSDDEEAAAGKGDDEQDVDSVEDEEVIVVNHGRQERAVEEQDAADDDDDGSDTDTDAPGEAEE